MQPNSGPFADLGVDAALASLILMGAVGAVVLVGLIVFIALRFLRVCRPNEVLIFSGRQHDLPGGSSVGYKVLQGGRGFRIPLLEQVARMDMRLISVQVEVQN